MAVIAAFELNQGIAASEATRQAYCAHGRLGTRVNHTDLFDGRHRSTDLLCQFCFQRGGGAITQALLRSVLHGGNDIWIGMAEDHGAPRAHVIDISSAVSTVEQRTACMVNKHRGATN